MNRHWNYLVVDESFKHKMPLDVIRSMDLIVVAQSDGSYKIVKNRFTGENKLLNEEAFLGFFSKHIWMKNDDYLS